MAGKFSLKKNETEILFLGSGTSTGVPMIGCDCPTCTSSDEKDKRLRSSAVIRWLDGSEIRHILIDASTDLRQQALIHGLNRIDAVLLTHPHADHVHGIDEIRSFNFLQKAPIPFYGSEFTLSRVRTMFDYIFTKTQAGGGKPQITMHPVNGDLELFGRKVIPLPVKHGGMDVLGFRVGPIAYITDCNKIPDETMELIKNVPLLVLGAVKFQSHVTHFGINEALEVSREVGAKKTYITHLSHYVMHGNVSLPDNTYLAYDGLKERLDG